MKIESCECGLTPVVVSVRHRTKYTEHTDYHVECMCGALTTTGVEKRDGRTVISGYMTPELAMMAWNIKRREKEESR